MCPACGALIWPGQRLCFVAEFKRAVHASCRRLQDLAIVTAGTLQSINGKLPHGLRPDTLATYAAEWSRYLQFAQRVGFTNGVPGRDGPWVPHLLWRFLLHRSEKCKPSTVFAGLSALAHFGHYHRQVLPTRKEDGNALLHRDIANMKREIALYYCSTRGITNLTYDVAHSTPLGRHEVELLLSAFQLVGRRQFQNLNRSDRHHVVASVLQHTKGMRFGHFLYRDYTVRSFVRGADGAFRLTTDWHRYQGQRRYVLEFAAQPRWDCLRYNVRRKDLSIATTLTAAEILQWHFDMLRAAGERLIFRPALGRRPTRQERKRWLQSALLDALPLSDLEARKEVLFVTPHAFRAGIAGDLLAAEVPWDTIAIWCRWHSMRAMRMYATRPALFAKRRSHAFRTILRH